MLVHNIHNYTTSYMDDKLSFITHWIAHTLALESTCATSHECIVGFLFRY